MDRRLDKRYLTGAVSAMEKQYGAEKTDSIIEDAWRRYAEIVDENADEPKKMYMHTRKRIYPAIAAFDAMTGNGISREEAAAFLAKQGIAVRAGLHCAPFAHESAGTLESGTVRVSFAHDASDAQTDAFLRTVSKLPRV